VRLVAWLVHLLTASSAVLALLALHATAAGRYRAAFAWLVVSASIDSIDGALARRVDVKRRVPSLDGARLDDIVDYLTFVFVPAWMVISAGLLPPAAALPVAPVVLLASAYGFSQTAAKTSDYFFTGFPSYWNIVALYLFALDLSPWTNAIVLLAFAALVFIPIGYVYPSRTPTLRTLTLLLGMVWGASLLVVIAQLPRPSTRLAWASLAYPVYYGVLSLVLHARRNAGRERGSR
jgi:phosphatidylcholine synthase